MKCKVQIAATWLLFCAGAAGAQPATRAGQATAPYLGAYELGRPLPHYGPRSGDSAAPRPPESLAVTPLP